MALMGDGGANGANFVAVSDVGWDTGVGAEIGTKDVRGKMVGDGLVGESAPGFSGSTETFCSKKPLGTGDGAA